MKRYRDAAEVGYPRTRHAGSYHEQGEPSENTTRVSSTGADGGGVRSLTKLVAVSVCGVTLGTGLAAAGAFASVRVDYRKWDNFGGSVPSTH